MDNIRNQLCGRYQLFAVCVTQCVMLGFDSMFLSLLIHQFFGPLLLVGTCVYNGCMLVAAVLVAINGFGRWDTWATCFVLLSVKAIALSGIAIQSFKVLLLTLLGIIGFCIAAEQSLILDLSIRRIPNPAKKLLIPLCFSCISAGSFLSSLLFEETTVEVTNRRDFITTNNSSSFYSNYKSFNVLQQIYVQPRIPIAYIAVGSSILQCFLGYLVYDLWKTKTNDSRPSSNDAETAEVSPADKLHHIHAIGGTLVFLSSGLFFVFPYQTTGFSLPSYGIVYLYAFLGACFASRLLFLIFACKFPVMFWLAAGILMSAGGLCLFGFELTKSLAAVWYGMGLSIMLPILSTLFSKSRGAAIHPLLISSIASSVVYPLAMSQIVHTYGTEIFTTANFLALFLMVCFFVCLLNVQSSTDKPRDENHARVWIFFQGQGVKRTRSIRKFIGSIRGSIRGSRYRRLRRHQRSPQPPNNNLLSPNLNTNRSYRSTESSRQKGGNFLELNPRRHNSIDGEEPTSIDCISPASPTPLICESST
ncbi:hypothetical protein M3Y94_01091800 [Aphelenchoides besseyi]|nr:hypothetical protein M3Y94_01091800 [Aphelenchoides besseyi]KAI6221702.1 hypothetical protein M3Y95_00990000 [Aphelenchoides besseyi]